MIGRILICGSRYWINIHAMELIISACVGKYGPDIAIIHGAARGADYEAGEAALNAQLTTWVEPAKWDAYGKAAGMIRNKLMLERYKPHLVIACHEDLKQSKGTGHMVKIARTAKVPVIHIRNTQDAENIQDELPENLCPEVANSGTKNESG